MGVFLKNAILLDLDPPGAQEANLRIENGLIAARGKDIEAAPGDEIIDCGGAVVLPGMVNGHMHLYSALAAGMPAPPKNPTNFHEILEYVWWRLDRALDATSIRLSGAIGALGALHCGTTTMIDHHASPSHIAGSLDDLEEGIRAAGLRAVLCYEVTDRNGTAGREAGLAENKRYIEKCRAAKCTQFAGLVGAHASFTCDDAAMEALGRMAEELHTGVHIHVAEDPCDEALTRQRYGIDLIKRLIEFGILRDDSVFGHGTHLSDGAIAHMNDVGASLAHNTRSNMNNAVGYTRIGAFKCPVQLGTDGIGSDLFAESKTAWFKSRDGRAGVGPDAVLSMLANSARRASRSLGVTLGKLQPGAAADIVLTDYVPFTPLHGDNVAGHLLFALDAVNVRDVLIAGEWKLCDHRLVGADENEIRRDARAAAESLWARMAKLP